MTFSENQGEATFYQAKNIKEFLQIAFDRESLPILGYEPNSPVRVGTFGAKFLVAGNDRTLNNFVQEYVAAVMSDMGHIKNI